MSEIQAIGGLEGPYFHESKEENLEKALESLSDYLLFAPTGWSADYSAYLVLKAIFFNEQHQDADNVFSHIEHKMNDLLTKQFYFQWDHIEFTQLIDSMQSEKPTISSSQLKAGIIACLKTLPAKVDNACSGIINNQFSLNVIFGQLTAIGFILQDTQLSPDLQLKGEAIANTSPPRFGSGVPHHFKTDIDELLDLLEKS
ncbi:MAG: hypothetical protein KFB95_08815 [Simkaniaceae bacterium]|nr:MAG: hypothetical protein KFB95_08815 [Simkaniaceae bacterium]